MCECLLWLSVCFTVLMMVLALCRQPVLILWPAPWLQRVGNKPLSSYLQTVQQSMRNYLGQSMGQPFFFFFFPLALPPLLSFQLYPLSHPNSSSSPSLPPMCLVLTLCSFSTHHPPPPLFSPAFLLLSRVPISKCDSLAARLPLTEDAFTHGTFSFAEETFLVILEVMGEFLEQPSFKLCKVVGN